MTTFPGLLTELFTADDLAIDITDQAGASSDCLRGVPSWPPYGREIMYDRFLGVQAWQGPPRAPDQSGRGPATNEYRLGDQYDYKYECTRLVKRFVETVYHIPLDRTGDGWETARNLYGEKGFILAQGKRTDIELQYFPAGSHASPIIGSIVSTRAPQHANGQAYGHVFIIKGGELSGRLKANMFEQNFSRWEDGRIVFPRGNIAQFTHTPHGGWRGLAYDDPAYPVIGWTNPVAMDR